MTEKRIDKRFAFFLGAGVLLIVLAVTGVFNSSSDVNISREEAIEIARPEIDFVPEQEDARLVRQGLQLAPVWAVSFSIPEDGESRKFERIMTVEIDARTSEIIRISTDGEGTVQPD
jgi:hypothetical protein